MTCARVLPFVVLLAGCPTESKTLILLHTTDEHSHLIGFGPEVDDHPAPTAAGTGTIKGGIGRRAKVLADERARAKSLGASTLTLSAGDNTMGTLAQAAFTSTAPDFVAMKSLGYDATCLGNHEFDFGPAALAAALSAANTKGGLVKVLSSNIHFSDTDAGDDPLAALYDAKGDDATKLVHKSWVLTTENGIKVGLVGIMGVDAARKATVKPPVRFSGADDGEAVDAVLTKIYADLQPVVDDLKNVQKVDIVIAMSHTGVNTLDLPASEDYKICQNVGGLDVILSGHTHVVAEAFTVTNTKTMKPCHIQSAGKFGEGVGRLKLQCNGGRVEMDKAGSAIVPVDDKVVSDPAFNVQIDDAIKGVEGSKLGSGMSFVEETLGRILGMTVADNTEMVGDLYFHPIGKTDFTVIGKADQKETPLMDMIADATLAAAEKYGGATNVSVVGQGVLRSDLEKSKSGNVSFGDVFRILPLGVSTANGTVGYPLCRTMLYALEMKAAFEVAAGYAYTSPDAGDFYLVGGGIKVEYDTSRPAIDSARLRSTPADYRNGRITKMYLGSDHSKPDVFDRLIFDVNAGGWQGITLADPFMVTANLYVVQFAYVAGVELKNAMGVPVSPNDTILHRSDGSEIKDWEALSEFLRAQPEMKTPARYMSTTPTRMICSGPLCKP